MVHSVRMKALKVILISILSLALFSSGVFFSISYFRQKPGGISVITTPIASVYVDGGFVGKTPYKGTFNPKEITLKLVPDITSGALLPFETKITLESGIETVIQRQFGESEDVSSNEIISFQKNKGATGIVVVSTPESAQVSIDDIVRGFTTFNSSSISPASHKITVKAPGYDDQTIMATLVKDLRLIVFIKLAKSNLLSASSVTPAPTPVLKNYVEIQKTPTGFLRVRTKPASGDEIAEVKPGEKYSYLDTDTATGWFEIQYEAAKPGLPEGITGWVSNQFAKKVSE